MAQITGMDKYKFRRALEEIEAAEGRGTELVTVYVPPERPVSDVTNYLRGELSQSSNIKSASTRKNVTQAIESAMSRLKGYRMPPPNGLVIFAGHVSVGADRTKMVSHVLEPPEPVASFLYRCDSKFYTEPLHEMLAEKDVYGLVVIARSEATIGLLRGKRIEPIKNLQSQVPSKHRMGGQSARRFERLIEIAAHEWYKKVADLMTEAFLSRPEIKAIIIGGPGYTKEYFATQDYLHHELKKKVLPTFLDTGYTDEYGLRELVEKARAKLRCENGDWEGEKPPRDGAALPPCPKDGGPLTLVESRDLIEDLTKGAEQMSTNVELISKDSEEGQLMLRAFGGI